jgi:putative ABC transport system permease protein
MTRAVLSALWSHWRRNPLQLFTLVTGLALATALWSGVQAINAEARASYDAAAETLGEGRYDQVVPAAGDSFPLETYVALRRAGWQVSPVLEGSLAVDVTTSVALIGIDPLTAPAGLEAVPLDDDTDLADFLGQPVLFAAPDAAARLAAREGVRIVIDPGVAPGTAITDIGTAERLLDQPGRLSRLIVLEDQPLGRPPLAEIAPALTLQASQGVEVGRLTDSFHLNLTAFGLLSFAVGIFIVNGAIGLAFEQRRGMMRTLRSLGVPLNRLVVLMAVELGALALAAGAIGVVLGYLLATALLPDVAATLQGLYGARVSGSIALRPVWWLSGLGIALAGAALAGSGALWRIARMPILASAGGRAWAVASSRARRAKTVLALVLFAASAVLLAVGDGLLAGFALLAFLLIGAALILPVVLDTLLAFGQRFAREARAEWFWADTRQQLPGLSLALMALLLAMASNIGVSTMVSSFRLTFTGFLDQRLAPELYVTTEDQRALEALVTETGGTVLPVLSVETRLAGLPADLFGARIGPTYRENWRFLDGAADAWDSVEAGTGVVINEQLARRAGLWVGDPLAVAPGTTLEIVGVVGDYGNPIGQAIIAEPLFQSLFPDARATRFGLRSADPEALRATLTDRLGLGAGAIVDQAAIKAFSLRIFERTFAVTGALNVLTLGVAGFAIFMSLITLAALRLPQLAPAWALGLTRAELGRLELIRALALAALTAVLALPLGLALAWSLLAVVNVAAFGWRLPMFVFPFDYAVLSAIAVAAAGLAAWWPARRLARTPPADLLKVFANER